MIALAERLFAGAIPAAPKASCDLKITRVTTVHDIDRVVWDAFVPRDSPHLRWGFLAAMEDSGQGRRPQYIQVWARQALVGVAVAYRLKVDLLTLTPRRYTRGLNALRTHWMPKLLFMESLACGPLITNCRSNVYLAPALGKRKRREAARHILKAIDATPDAPNLMLFFEFSESENDIFGPAFAVGGFLKGVSLPGTRLGVHWKSLDDYVAQMRKAFRRTVVKDRAAGTGLHFEIIDDWSALADEAWALYKNVADKAEYTLQELTCDFFRALATVEESRLVVARDGASGKMVGMELLLCGETVVQDVFTGQAIGYDPEQRLYFNLIYPVIDYAGREGYREISLGPTCYTFKARLGASTYPLSIFVRHRNPVVQAMLVALKSILFTDTKPVIYNVFRADTPPHGST